MSMEEYKELHKGKRLFSSELDEVPQIFKHSESVMQFHEDNYIPDTKSHNSNLVFSPKVS